MIYLICAPPRQGKTYFATSIARSLLRPSGHLFWKKSGKTVYSNYPIVDKKIHDCEHCGLSKKDCFKKKCNFFISTLQWRPEYIYENVQDSTIIIDEAYRDFSSRSYKDFDKDKHTFFATNGHQNNDIYIIAQNASRVDVILREMTNELYFVRKFSIPFTTRPLWFIVDVYHDLNEMGKLTPSPFAVTKKKLVIFKKNVARAYDTHFFRKNEPSFTAKTWLEVLNNK